MHHKRKMKTFGAFKKRNTQILMKQLKGSNFTKNGNFAHEGHGVISFSSCHLKILAMVRAKLQAFLSNKRRNEISLPRVMNGIFLKEKMKKMMAPPSGDGGFNLKKVRALKFLKKWSL